MRRITSCVLGWLLLCVAVCGCGDGGPRCVRVSGRITLAGGDWPKPGTLTFAPVVSVGGSDSGAQSAHPGSAQFDQQGNFVATTFAPGDGLVPGRYAVNVECWEVPPSMENPQAAKSHVPAGFKLEFEVRAGEPDKVVTWDVPRS